MAPETLLIVLIAVVLAGVAAILLLCRFRPTVSPVELLRWGFLIMLPAAIVVSVAAWPGLRTLSVFRILYVLLCLGAAVWFLLNRRLPSNLHVRGFLLLIAFWLVWTLVSLTWAADKAAGLKYSVFLSMMVSVSVGTVLAVNSARILRILLVMLLVTFATATPQPTMELDATPTTAQSTPPTSTNTPRPSPTNTPKPPPSTVLTRGPYLQWVSPHGIVIAWETSSEVDSVIEYGTTQAYGSTASDYSWTTRHAVTLTGLNPYTTYHYRVKTSAQVLSEDRTFKSAAGPGQSHFTFVVTGDTNSGIAGGDLERYRESADEGHAHSVTIIWTLNPDFYLHAGDLTYAGSDMAAWDDFFSFEGDLMSKITMFPTPGERDGNHYNYFNLFYLPNNERWYSFDYGNAHFISLQIDGYLDVGPGSEQYLWLENDLASTDKTWKFVFFHFPPYSYGPEGPKPEARAVHPLLAQYGVDMVFSANDRNYQRYEVDDITYLVTGGGGGYTGRLTGGGDRIPIFMERTKHVMRITVAGNTVHSVAYRLDAEGSEMDPFTLTAD